MDWTVVSALATGGGTLVLAGATFASVRSANRAARVAERSLLAGLQPLLVSSRLDDPVQKIHFAEGKWVTAAGGGAAAEVTDEAIYLALSLRNAGAGMAVLHSWDFYPQRVSGDPSRPIDRFNRLTRDIYVAAGGVGFWQGTFRDPAAPDFAAAREAIEARRELTVDLLYGDYEGGSRVISRFFFLPREDGGWLSAAARHSNLDRAAPR